MPKFFDHAESKAARKSGQGFVLGQGQQRLEQGCDLAVNEMLQAALHLLRNLGAGDIINENLDLRLERIRPATSLPTAECPTSGHPVR